MGGGFWAGLCRWTRFYTGQPVPKGKLRDAPSPPRACPLRLTRRMPAIFSMSMGCFSPMVTIFFYSIWSKSSFPPRESTPSHWTALAIAASACDWAGCRCSRRPSHANASSTPHSLSCTRINGSTGIETTEFGHGHLLVWRWGLRQPPESRAVPKGHAAGMSGGGCRRRSTPAPVWLYAVPLEDESDQASAWAQRAVPMF